MPLPLEMMLPQLNTIHLLGNSLLGLQRDEGAHDGRVDARMFTRLQFAHECRVHELIELKL
jgi:hypothetical protein